LTDLLILTESELRKYHEGDKSSALTKVDHRDVRILKFGLDSIESFTMCLCHTAMHEYTSEPSNLSFRDREERRKKAFSQSVADLSSVSGVADRCKRLLELPFETACSKLMEDLEAYRKEKTYSRY